MRPPRPIADRRIPALAGLLALASLGAGPSNPLAGLVPPEEWSARFWSGPDAAALRAMAPTALARLVPEQAGLRFCRCPGCDAPEADDPLAWSIRRPAVVTCKRCRKSYPDETAPAPPEKDKDKKPPEEAIEVVPGRVHHYPYQVVEPGKQRHPDERLYLAARRDHEAREYLAKAALYAALEHARPSTGAAEPWSARMACTLLVRFAQVYPFYALHLDQPGRPKFFEPARRPPPYRRGYGTAKWDWSGSLGVPLNLAIAYALVRDDPAIAEAGRLLGVADPTRSIERDLFLASARFVRDQPDESDEPSLQADRGMLAVGRLLGDDELVAEAGRRLAEFARRGFTHDGLWRAGDAASHRRVVGTLDGWIARLMAGPPGALGEAVPMLGLARSAGGGLLDDPPAPEILRASWPAPGGLAAGRRPGLLGGAGVALLAVGEGADSIELELRGMGQSGPPRSRRQALRLAIGGRAVLGDLDELPPRPDGWDRASASHNTVLVDGLNQRETLPLMREPAAGGDFLFHAADPDFQVAVLDDPRSYPRSTTRYRQTVVACSGPRARYAVAVFEVRGGVQHDQVFHAAPGPAARWETSVPTAPGPASLLAPTIPHLASSPAGDGRWFVQSYGEFAGMAHGRLDRPSTATLAGPGLPGVRLHLLGDAPARVVTATTPREPPPGEPGRAALLLRRRSEEGSELESTFVTVFEPAGASPARVGRMTATPGFVALYLETLDGPEHLVINLRPGASRAVALADGRELATDGQVVRVRREELTLAGGTVASIPGASARQAAASGRILGAARHPTAEGRGWFEADAAGLDDPGLAGRTLLIRHGDATIRGWTLRRVEPLPGRRARLHVVEEPGFLIEGADRSARYYQLPGTVAPAPHTFTIATIGRSPARAP